MRIRPANYRSKSYPPKKSIIVPKQSFPYLSQFSWCVSIETDVWQGFAAFFMRFRAGRERHVEAARTTIFRIRRF